jgi:hypothetical protein
LFESLNAERIGERMEHDASSGAFPDEAAAAWLHTWLPLFQEGAATL